MKVLNKNTWSDQIHCVRKRQKRERLWVRVQIHRDALRPCLTCCHGNNSTELGFWRQGLQALLRPRTVFSNEQRLENKTETKKLRAREINNVNREKERNTFTNCFQWSTNHAPWVKYAASITNNRAQTYGLREGPFLSWMENLNIHLIKKYHFRS